MKKYFWGIQNHEKINMDFVHKRFSVTGGLRPPDPLADLWTVFLLFFKQQKKTKQKNNKQNRPGGSRGRSPPVTEKRL